MNTFFSCLFVAILFIGPATDSSKRCSYNNPDGACSLLSDDVTMSSQELKDGNGNVYGMRYTLTNNTGTAKRVTWSFTGYYNCSSSGGFSGVESLIGYGYVIVTTFTQVDKTKNWSEGSYTLTVK